ncbi:MAG TPA: hypothetical protein PLJ00_05825 [Chitinophagales bacterium]|nr:hypothetical protein [Chitinophagales bacterium]
MVLTEITDIVELEKQAEPAQGANNNASNNNNADNGGGDGGAGGGGTEAVTDEDRQLLSYAKGVFGKFGGVEGFKKIEPLVADATNLAPHLERAKFLAQNPGHDELIDYLRRGGSDIQLFNQMRNLDTTKLNDLDAIVYKRMYELGIDETTARAAVAFEYKQGDEFANISDGEKAAMTIRLRTDGGVANKFLSDFKAKTINPEPGQQQSPENLAEIEKAWQPVIASAKSFKFNYAKDVVTHDKTKVAVAHVIENDEQIGGDIEAILSSFAKSGQQPNDELITMAKNIALGRAFERVFSQGIEAVSRQFLGHIAEKFYGVKPVNDNAGNNNNNQSVKKGLELVEDTGRGSNTQAPALDY